MSVSTGKPPLLEITVYLADGRQVRFRQNDAAEVQGLLARLQPSRLFANRLLLIGGARALDAFPTSTVVRVDLESDHLTDYPHPPGVDRVVEITEADFRTRNTPANDAARRTAFANGEPITNFSVLQLVTGETLYQELHLSRPDVGGTRPERTALDQAVFVNNAFASNGFHLMKRGGGLIILNPALVTRCTFFPGPQVARAGIWAAEGVL